jgi:ABC-2 type transport system ATP-binding protein
MGIFVAFTLNLNVENSQMIQLLDYSKTYGRFTAVQKLNLRIRRGETYALLGPNGSGKSTILRSIAGLGRPSTGRILIYDEDIWEQPEKVKENISYLPQRLEIPHNLKVIEVLEFFCGLKSVDKTRIDWAISKIDIIGGIDQKTGELSGGMLQRLGLIITLLKDTEVYLLDEPTLNLDVQGIQQFRNLLEVLKAAGKTILFSSHSLTDAEKLTDRVGIMIKGKMVMDSSGEQFKLWVKNNTLTKLVVDRRDAALVDIALDNGALKAAFDNGYFRYQAEEANQIKIIEAIRKRGFEILSLSSDRPNLDRIVEDMDD